MNEAKRRSLSLKMARWEGMKAFRDGVPIDENPYRLAKVNGVIDLASDDLMLHAKWMLGWISACDIDNQEKI